MRGRLDAWTSPAPHARRLVLAVQALLLAVTLAFVISTLTQRRGFDNVLDGWLQGAGYVLAAVVAALRPTLSAADRRLWSLVAGALIARAVAFVLALSFVRNLDPVPYPSVSDAGWLLCSALLIVAVLIWVRAKFTRLIGTVVLDGLIGVCTVGAFALLVLPGVIDRLDVPGTTTGAVVTNTIYPVLDVALLVAVLGAVVAYRWRPPPSLATLGAGVVGFAVLDCAYLYQISVGSFRPGTPLSGLSLGATTVMALSAWAPEGRSERHDSAYLPGLVIPAALSSGCLGLLMWAAFHEVHSGAAVLAGTGVAATVCRTVVGFHELKQLSSARSEARTDELTGLPNRRAFNELLSQALAHRPLGSPLSLLILDVDSFKDINDSLGHVRGDELLTMMTPRLLMVCRAEDVAARIGGDEFAVLLNGTDAAGASDVAVRLRAACRGPFDVGDQTLTVGVSVGIATFPGDGQDPGTLLQHADHAMYAAKDERTGQASYRPDYLHNSRARLEAVSEIRAAITNREFVVHYQPKVSLTDGQVLGVEALVRWQHPIQGLLAPYAFLRQAERGGVMRELTLDVLEQALMQWAAWQRQGITTSIAVNLSVGDLLDWEFPPKVEECRRRNGVPGDALILELTEDVLLADPGRGHGVIEALAAQGVRVQVDDYGTGFSTLAYLRDLPLLDGLKLDRSFIAPIVDDRRCRAILASTIALAADLGLELVAEGVETEAARDLLASLGCPQAQGYLFSRPVPASAVQFGTYNVMAQHIG